MADYQCFPLWADGGDSVDPRDLPITPELAQALIEWAERFDAGLNWEDPMATVVDPGEAARFEADGSALALRLQTELGEAFQVLYRPTGAGPAAPVTPP